MGETVLVVLLLEGADIVDDIEVRTARTFSRRPLISSGSSGMTVCARPVTGNTAVRKTIADIISATLFIPVKFNVI